MVEASCKYRINLNPYILKGITVTDTIKLVEQPVGTGKTFHIIRNIVNAGGLIIYCAPTKVLANQIKHDICDVISSRELNNSKGTPVYIVTDEDKGYCSTVSERLMELILSKDNSDAIIVCTLAGLERVNEGVISTAINEQGKDITLIIDELPNLFSAYRHSFEGSSYKRLEGLITVENNIPEIDIGSEYNDTLEDRTFNDDITKLLQLIPRGTVRLEKSSSDNSLTFYGYDLKENLNEIIRHVDSAYLLAATITKTLDYIILNDVWGFKLEDCKRLNSQINDNKVREKDGDIKVYPLLDKVFSRSKATNGTYKTITPDMDSCLMGMIEASLGFIANQPALIIPNNWAKPLVNSYLKDKDNIELLSPNVKGINDYQDRHLCCTIFSSKPDIFTNQSLQLISERYGVTKLGKAYTLQAELDMIVQMCGRTSIRDRDSRETCHFIVSDINQAKHVLDTYVENKTAHDSLLDKSLMLKWSDYSSTKMGRPKNEERLEMGRDMVKQLEHAKSIGEPMKQKDLMKTFDVKESAISKILNDVGYEK